MFFKYLQRNCLDFLSNSLLAAWRFYPNLLVLLNVIRKDEQVFRYVRKTHATVKTNGFLHSLENCLCEFPRVHGLSNMDHPCMDWVTDYMGHPCMEHPHVGHPYMEHPCMGDHIWVKTLAKVDKWWKSWFEFGKNLSFIKFKPTRSNSTTWTKFKTWLKWGVPLDQGLTGTILDCDVNDEPCFSLCSP